MNLNPMFTAANVATIAADARGYCWISSDPPATLRRLAASVRAFTMMVLLANQLFILAPDDATRGERPRSI